MMEKENSYLFDKRTMEGFVSVYNQNTDQYRVARIDELFQCVDFVAIMEQVGNVRSPRGNYQMSTGAACGQSCTDRSTEPTEFSCPLPVKRSNTDLEIFVAVYRALSQLAKTLGVDCAQEGWTRASLENAWRRGLCSSKYFVCCPESVFEGYTLAWMELSRYSPLFSHSDVHNCPNNSEILVVSKVFEHNGRYYRVTLIAYMRKSLHDAWKRLQTYRMVGPYVQKFLSNECTAPYQRAADPAGYFRGIGTEGILVVRDLSSKSILHTSLVHRPHINKQSTHLATIINLILSLHATHPLSVEEAIEVCLIFGFCNSLDIYTTIVLEWIHDGLPNVPEGKCLADCFSERANVLFGGVQKTNVNRCQPFGGKGCDIRKLASLHVSLLAKRKAWLKARPYVPGAPDKDIREAYSGLHAVFTQHKGTTIGPFKSGETIHVLCGTRIFDLVEITQVCDPCFSDKDPAQVNLYRTHNGKRSFQLSLPQHFMEITCGSCGENCMCEATRKNEPLACQSPGDSFHVFFKALDGTASIKRYFPLPGGRVHDAGTIPIFRPRLVGDSPTPGLLWVHGKEQQEFERLMSVRKALLGMPQDVKIKFSGGSGTVTRFLLTPKMLGKGPYAILRDKFLTLDTIGGHAAVARALCVTIAGMTTRDVALAVAALKSVKRPNKLHPEYRGQDKITVHPAPVVVHGLRSYVQDPVPDNQIAKRPSSQNARDPRPWIKHATPVSPPIGTAVSRNSVQDKALTKPEEEPCGGHLACMKPCGGHLACMKPEEEPCGGLCPGVRPEDFQFDDVFALSLFQEEDSTAGTLPSLAAVVSPTKPPPRVQRPVELLEVQHHRADGEESTSTLVPRPPPRWKDLFVRRKRRKRATQNTSMPSESIGVPKASPCCIEGAIKQSLRADTPLAYVQFNIKCCAVSCLLHDHPRAEIVVQNLIHPDSRRSSDFEADRNLRMKTRGRQAFPSPKWKPLAEDTKQYDFSWAGTPLTTGICLWLGGSEVYDEEAGVNRLMFDSKKKAALHLYLSFLCHVGHSEHHMHLVDSLCRNCKVPCERTATAGTWGSMTSVLLCLPRQATASERQLMKAGAPLPGPKLPDGFHATLGNGNYLYLVTDRRDNENSRVFLCFVHRDSRDLMAPDRSKRSRTFYVQLADSTVVTDTVADLDALPSFPSPPPLDLLDDAQWI